MEINVGEKLRPVTGCVCVICDFSTSENSGYLTDVFGLYMSQRVSFFVLMDEVFGDDRNWVQDNRIILENVFNLSFERVETLQKPTSQDTKNFPRKTTVAMITLHRN